MLDLCIIQLTLISLKLLQFLLFVWYNPITHDFARTGLHPEGPGDCYHKMSRLIFSVFPSSFANPGVVSPTYLHGQLLDVLILDKKSSCQFMLVAIRVLVPYLNMLLFIWSFVQVGVSFLERVVGKLNRENNRTRLRLACLVRYVIWRKFL